ncbi:MAG TPA: hypothetical protein DIC59_03785 [Candidatus Competibacteraceae bacterium]|nr:hypothetical protein [Candidatus Competibacteraceae bacterium]
MKTSGSRKSTDRQAAASGMGWRSMITALGVDRWVRRLCGGRGAILMLHGLKESETADWQGNPGLTITGRQLTAIVETLRSEGYELVSLDVALERLAAPRAGPRFACLTFDDGYRDNYQLLYPLLRQLAAPATIYVTTGFIDGEAPAWWHGIEAVLQHHPTLDMSLADRHYSFSAATTTERDAAFQQACDLLRKAAPAARAKALSQLEQIYQIDFRSIDRERMMTWDMIREMAASGLVEFGAHTVTHPALRDLPQAEARLEMTQSRQRLETQLERAIRHFAYPYGDAPAVDQAVTTLARDCGFASAVLAYGGPLRAGAGVHALPRIPFGGSDTAEDLRIRLSGARAALAPAYE